MRSNHIDEDKFILLALEGVVRGDLSARAESPWPAVRLCYHLDLVRDRFR